MLNESGFEINDLDLSRVYTLGFSWLSSQLPKADTFSVKELSSLILLYLEKEEIKNVEKFLSFFLSLQNPDGSFGDIRETARFVSVLFVLISKKQKPSAPSFQFENGSQLIEAAKIAASKSISYLKLQKERWNENIYDLVYILSAFGDAGIFEPELCLNLCEHDLPDWQHPGTTALIITALQKQKNLSLFQESENALISEFIKKKNDWLVSVRENGCWKYPATSNLVLHALILCDQKRKALDSLSWLIQSQKENGSWEDNINTTALSLLTL
ncbi:MAG: hypothetical protein FWH46_04645 [Methanimicrococcus sp.]|nr:hypothetical protein [Methanimicrococcus sp.]